MRDLNRQAVVANSSPHASEWLGFRLNNALLLADRAHRTLDALGNEVRMLYVVIGRLD